MTLLWLLIYGLAQTLHYNRVSLEILFIKVVVTVRKYTLDFNISTRAYHIVYMFEAKKNDTIGMFGGDTVFMYERIAYFSIGGEAKKISHEGWSTTFDVMFLIVTMKAVEYGLFKFDLQLAF